MNGNEPATKSDLQALGSDVDGKLQALESRFDGKLDVLEQRMMDRVGQMIHDSETRLLQAFYGFAETNNKRLLQFEATDVLVISRISTIESRLMEVEKRLNLPPAN